MNLYKGKTALITGASGGIGAAFAKALATVGAHLILVARSEEKLRTLAGQLASQHAIRVEVIVADLSRVGVANMVFECSFVTLLPTSYGCARNDSFIEQRQQSAPRVGVAT